MISPAAAVRTAATSSSSGLVLRMNPAQPASVAVTSIESSAAAVSTTILASGRSALSSAIESTPRPSGRRWSSRTTSGAVETTIARAWARVAAVPTTVRSGSADSASRRLSANMSWSSTMSRRTVAGAGRRPPGPR